MARHKIILCVVITVLIALLVSQSMSQTRRTNRRRTRPNRYQPAPRFQGSSGFRSGGNSSSGSGSTRREVTEESKEKSIQGAVGATDEQWKKIKPLVENVRQIKEACITIKIAAGGGGGGSSQSYGGPQGRVTQNTRSAGGGFGGGASVGGVTGGSSTLRASDGSSFKMSWAWYKPWARKGAQSEDEKLCDKLFNLLRSDKADEQQIKQAMSDLNKAREQLRTERAEIQQKLRESLTVDQEARLVALGWLE